MKRVRQQLDELESMERDLRTWGADPLDEQARIILANGIRTSLRVIRAELKIKQARETAEARAIREEAGL